MKHWTDDVLAEARKIHITRSQVDALVKKIRIGPVQRTPDGGLQFQTDLDGISEIKGFARKHHLEHGGGGGRNVRWGMYGFEIASSFLGRDSTKDPFKITITGWHSEDIAPETKTPRMLAFARQVLGFDGDELDEAGFTMPTHPEGSSMHGSTYYTNKDLTKDARRAVKGKGRYLGWALSIPARSGAQVVLLAFYQTKDGKQSHVNIAI